MITLAVVKEILAEIVAVDISTEVAPRRAAVAVVLREGELGAEVLLMQRTKRAGDRWSGQVSFPGGREEVSDESLEATAIRETREEVAIDLDRDARTVGRLSAIQARSRSGLAGLSVWPFVFFATGELSPRPSAEAETVFWLPLSLVLGGELDDVYPYQIGETSYELPCWVYQGQTVWGMTHRMLSDFLELLRKRET